MNPKFSFGAVDHQIYSWKFCFRATRQQSRKTKFLNTYEGCPRSLWTTAVTLSFFGRFDFFLYKIYLKHIIKNHQYYFDTPSYVAKTRFHSDRGTAYRRMGKSCFL